MPAIDSVSLGGEIMDQKQIDELIQLLQKYELSIAVLYEKFASIIPSSRDTWMAFANEERMHAKWIGALHAQLQKENISFEQTKFTVQSTKLSIDYIERQTDSIDTKKADLMQTLTVAVNIETSLLESAFFRVFKLTGPKAKKIQDSLIEATKEHLSKLVEWRAKIKKA